MKSVREKVSVVAAVFALGAVAGEIDVGGGSSANTYNNTTAYAAASKVVKTGKGVTTLDLGDMTGSFTGEIEIREGELKVKTTPNSFGAPTKITVRSGATLDLSWSEDSVGKIPQTEIVIAGTGASDNRGAIRRNGSLKTLNTLFGKITLAADARIVLGTQTGFDSNSGQLNLNGFTLTKASTGILYCNNTFAYGADGTTANPGNIVIEGGTLFLHNGNALKGGGSSNKITLKNGTTLILRHSGPLAWSVVAVGNATVVSDDSNTADPPRNRLAGPVTAAGALTVNASDSNAVMSFANGPVTLGGALTVNGKGSVSFVEAVVTNTATARVTVENETGAFVGISGASELVGKLSAAGYGQTRFYVGETAGTYGAVSVEDGSIVTNYALRVGGEGTGAIYQRGGASHWCTGDAALDRMASAVGSYGYVGQSGGSLSLTALADGSKKTTLLGVNGKAAFSLSGGTAAFNNSDNIAFAYRAGPLAWFQNGGAVVDVDEGFDFGDSASRNYAGRGEVTVAGRGSLMKVGTWLRFLWTNAVASAFVNLNDGGTLEASRLYRVSSNYNWYFNLNGGVIKPRLSQAHFSNGSDEFRRPTQSTVYEGGFAVDTSSVSGDGAVWMHISFTSPAETGRRVAAIAMPDLSSEKRLAGSPLVTITGDGVGASAFALFDDNTRTVTNIVVTSPGWGYTSASAELSGGGLSQDYTATVTLEDQPSSGWKGFTKRGARRLNMYGANTFKGDVTVEEGILGFHNATAPQCGMPMGAGVTIANGATLTFEEMHTAVTVPFIAGAGATSYGDFTVTDRIECTAADIFEGRHLTVDQNITLVNGVKIVVTDPENLAQYRNGNGATLLECKKTLALLGNIELAFPEGSTENVERWRVVTKGNSILLKPVNGLMIVIR